VAFARSLEAVVSELDATRWRLADTAEFVARVAEAVAITWEESASRRDAERRSAMAAWHRELARTERYNAAALRGGQPDLLLPMPRPPARNLPGRVMTTLQQKRVALQLNEHL
jgi:hypothetical protein